MTEPVELNPSDYPDLTDAGFRALAARWRGVTLLSVERLWALYDSVRHLARAEVPGAIVECGTFKGGSIGLVLETLVGLGRTDRDIVLFDTFDGFPDDVDELLITGARFRRGDWVTENFLGELQANLGRTGYPLEKIKIRPGRVEDTIPAEAPDAIALLHLDTDYYGATLHQLNHLYPRLSSGGVLQIDDYGHFFGCRQAVDEYFARVDVQPIVLFRIDYTGRVGVKAEPKATVAAERPSQPPRVSIADEVFISEALAKIPGWLFEPAGVLTLQLMRGLISHPDGDVVLEIGVYGGRYLALMRHAGVGPLRTIVGMDTFEHIAEKAVRETLTGLFGSLEHVELWRANSQDLAPADLRAKLDGKSLRFVSVDGDHAAGAVRRDMELIDAVLARDGIVAADDFMNPLAVGVTEGLGSFFATGSRDLVAFAYASNKLFLCRPDYHNHYTRETRAFVSESQHLTSLDATRDFWTMHDAYYNQPLFGRNCLILSRGPFG